MYNLLVTGGNGFIGRHLINRLCSKNEKEYNITVIDITDPSRIESKTDVNFYRGDIRNLSFISDIIKKHRINICVHLAAKISVRDSLIHPIETMDVNVMGTLSIIEACARNSVKNIVFASSAAVYGDPKYLPVSEDSLPQPVSPYGASKLSGESILFSYLHSKKIQNAIALRFFNVYGKGQNPEYAGVISCFKERLLAGKAPVIYGDGGQTRDFVSVNDVINAIISSAETLDVSGVFNIASGRAVSILDLATMMIKSYGFDFIPMVREAKEGEVRNSFADISKARLLLGYQPIDTINSAFGAVTNYPLQIGTQLEI